MDWPGIILVIIIVIAAEAFHYWKTGTFSSEGRTNDADEYQAKYLLTSYEWKNYMDMREYAAAHGLIICPKIRLADLVEPKKGKNKSEWQKQFNRIKAKHVDFVFCDPEMHVKLIVELDDRSHEREDRQNRDNFVNAALIGAGYKIVHIHRFDDAAVEAMNAILHPAPEQPTQEAAIG